MVQLAPWKKGGSRMAPDLSNVIASRRLPRLLIAEKQFSEIEPLIRICGDRRLGVDFDVCASNRSAVGMLLAVPYQLVISGALLTEMEDFVLLDRIQTSQPFVPLVVTADASEKLSAQRALTKGAFDILTKPLDHERTVHTITLALWQTKLMKLIASKEKALEEYRQHLALYPGCKSKGEAFERALSALDKTLSSFQRTIQQVEESIKCLTDVAEIVTREARERALETLDALRK